jgi:peptidoglycan hydrolase-like protein with peptidoglycan-binding domain
MNYGLMSIVTVAGAVSTAVLWGMSASDPYWRLVEAPSVPAPAYQGEDLRALLATVPQDIGNTDTGAINPAADPRARAGYTGLPMDTVAHDAEAASIPAPMIALAPPFEPQLMTGPAIDAMIAYEMPRAAVPVPVDFAADTGFDLGSSLVVGRASTPLPAPLALRDGDSGLVANAASARALDQFVVPATPAQPHIAASEDTEQMLALKRGGRIDVQRRLALAGFDPRGYDGVFGTRTRGAITDFQIAWGFPATGYLDTSVYGELNQRTEDAYQALRRQAAAAPSAAPDLAPAARERQFASAEDDGRCARQPDGRIIARQSLACDLAGFTETFVSLGRNTLEYGVDGIAAASPPLAAAAGADR